MTGHSPRNSVLKRFCIALAALVLLALLVVIVFWRMSDRQASQKAGEVEEVKKANGKGEVHNRESNRRTAESLLASGQRFKSRPYLFELLSDDKLKFAELILLCSRSPVREFPASTLTRNLFDYILGSPVNEARHHLYDGKLQKAEALLLKSIAKDSANSEARALLGRIYASSDPEKFTQWLRDLPSDCEHPDIWLMRGMWAKENGQSQESVRAFWEAVSLDPDLIDANYQLSLALGDDERASLFRERFALLKELDNNLFDLLKLVRALPDERIERTEKVAGVLEKLGRFHESHAWYNSLPRAYLQKSSTKSKLEELRSKMLIADLRVAKESNPALQVDFSSYPLPRFSSKDEVAIKSTNDGRIQFANDAAKVGISFNYQNSGIKQSPLRMMYELMGGGIGVVDFNGDRLPDVYLAQGRHWKSADSQTEFIDRLFLNDGGGTFVDVTNHARIQQGSFGQGITIGDFDSDGFPDIYIGNIGQNRLLRNNGDGTYADVTEQSNIAANLWTTSCVLADLSGDGLPDIYDVNYLRGERLFNTLCPQAGAPRSCSPDLFDPEHDNFWLNLGDGTFRESSQEQGFVPDEPGNGLGVVVADFEQTGQLEMFVANDVTPNLYFSSESIDGQLRYQERGVEMGLAYDERGAAQGCMGIAIGDLNADRHLDLFVSNFKNEANVFYVSDSHFYDDRTRASRLYSPSVPTVAFGTQFLDADLNGKLDLVVTNGDVADFRDRGIPLAYPAQFFRNTGNLKFKQESDIGSYFEKEFIGRALVKLDWNQDGLHDIAVSHIDAPFALLTNQSERAGNYIALRVIGTNSCRDAIGTIASFEVDGTEHTQQLTAGDGFQSSNERLMIIGVGPIKNIPKLAIKWPNGRSQVFNNVKTNRHYTAIEGSTKLIP